MDGIKDVLSPQSEHGLALTSVYNPHFLRQQARWIRDDLDPQVARDGPDILHSDDVLNLDDLLRRLFNSQLGREDIRFSRLHLALLAISGQATRWPKRLIERSDALIEKWEGEFGSLKKLGTLLYERGGRLHGVCRPEDVATEKLVVKWVRDPGVKLSPYLARRSGNLGFTPGDWWISPLFAFRDGIVDSTDASGSIVADADGAYAIVMTHEEEVSSPSPDAFTYRARNEDRGRYRLTAATRESRRPIRVLRAHSLRSLWAPKAGLRYDGLHIVTGWCIKLNPKSKEMVYQVNFKRLASEPSMDVSLRYPLSDEAEDYKEYKRIRQLARETLKLRESGKGETELLSSSPSNAGDAAFDSSEDEKIDEAVIL